MKNYKKGFLGIIILIVVAIVAIGGGAYVYSKTNQKPIFNVESDQSKITEEQSTNNVSDQVDSSKKGVVVVSTNIPALQKNYDSNKKVQYMTQKSALTAAMSEVRYKAEIQASQSGLGYSNICANVSGWITTKYNEGSVDDVGIKKYEPVTKIEGLTCVNSKNKYALSVPLLQNNSSLAVTCLDSSGFFKEGTINSTSLSCEIK